MAVPCVAKTFPANAGSVAQENAAADRATIKRYENAAQVALDVDNGVLVPIPITTCPKLPVERRYIRRAAADFMLDLDMRFNRATHHYLIVDSAVRPAGVQKSLARRNRNAAPAFGARASSHERGTTFDIARKTFDGRYFKMTPKQWQFLKVQLLYYRAIGRIFVIEERACIHIMVREDTGGMGELADPGGL